MNNNKNYPKIVLRSFLLAIVAVFVIDYFSHLLFSNPMETLPYFLAKLVLYFVCAIIFLSIFDLKSKEFTKVILTGVVVSLLWGFYYNIIPFIMDRFFNIDFYPFGIALGGITFLGMGLFGTGLAFGVVHTLAFIGGYYSTKPLAKNS